MSKIADLGNSKAVSVGERYANLGKILQVYDEALRDLEADLKIRGKSLEDANRENPSLYSYYDQRRVELKTLVEFIEKDVERTRSRLFRSLTENSNRELSDRAKNQYIDGEPAYLDVYEIYLEVKEMYEQYNSAIEAFKLRGYALKNITEIRVASLESVVL